MTSPNISRPPATNGVYNDVHSQGSTYGQDLKSEAQVRELLTPSIESPFQRAFTRFGEFVGGMIGGIADAIRGEGGSQFGPIAGAVDERIVPISNAITASGERHAELAEKVDGIVIKQGEIVSEAEALGKKVDGINKNTQDTIDNATKLIQEEQGKFSSEYEEKVAKALNDSDIALKRGQDALAKQADLNTKFNKEQVRVNKVTQEQLWSHQDMLELLDIRSPKTYFWLPGQSTPDSNGEYTKWTNPYSGKEANRIERPFTTTYEEGYVDGAIVYIACKGNWTGQISFHANWSEGQLDEWTFDVTESNRVFRYSGGAVHITPRFYSLTVHPDSLRRTYWISIFEGQVNPSQYTDVSKPGRYFDYYTDPEGFVRLNKKQYIRVKNVAKCNVGIYIRNTDGGLDYIEPGDYIVPTMIFPEDQTHLPNNTKLAFTEVGDEISRDWSVDQNKPPSDASVTRPPFKM